MVDSDVALLYDVSTKVLKQQVKRNIGRFPSDFMFVLSTVEKRELVTNCDQFRNLKHAIVNPLSVVGVPVAGSPTTMIECERPGYLKRQLIAALVFLFQLSTYFYKTGD